MPSDESLPRVNPYAATSSSDGLAYPIYFAGTLDRDDLRMALHDAIPVRGWRRLRTPLLVVFCVVTFGYSVITLAPAGEPIPAIVWPLSACVVFPVWFSTLRFFSRAHRRRTRRTETMAEHQDPFHGWIEDDRLVLYDESSALIGRWNFYGPVFIFPTHVMIPLGVDSTIRVVLPYRFFASAADVRLVCRFLNTRLGAIVNKPPSDRQLAQIEFAGDASAGWVTPQQASDWSADDWPMVTHADESQTTWTVDLAGKRPSAWLAVKTAIAVLVLMLWYCLPMWMAVAMWLMVDYQFFGHWGFLTERIFSTAIVIGPAVLLIAVFVYASARAAMQVFRLRSQPLDIHLRASGIYLAHASFDNWFSWKSVAQVITNSTTAGWVVSESDDQILYSDANFDSMEQFQSFQAKLQELGPKEADSAA